MALVRFIPSRKIPLLFCSRNVDQFELQCLGSLRAFFSTQKLIGDEPVLVSFFLIQEFFLFVGLSFADSALPTV